MGLISRVSSRTYRMRATGVLCRAGKHGWSNNNRQWANTLRRGGRPDRFQVPLRLYDDKYFSESFTKTLEQVNFNLFPQHNSLRNYLAVAARDPFIKGHINTYGMSPKVNFPQFATHDRYNGTIFMHSRPRDDIVTDPRNIPLYNMLPAFYRDEIEAVPSDDYLYSNQHMGQGLKSTEIESQMPERRPQYSGTWIKSNWQDGIPMQKDLLPIRYTFPPHAHIGLWGGVGVLQGWRYARGYKLNRRYKKEWRPKVHRLPLVSLLVNNGTALKIDVTPRTMELIDQAGGFDEYILSTPVCELNSVLGNLLKRDMLRVLTAQGIDRDGARLTLTSTIASANKLAQPYLENTSVATNKSEFEALLAKYGEYARPFDEISWIGLPLPMALQKQLDIEIENGNPRYTESAGHASFLQERNSLNSFE